MSSLFGGDESLQANRRLAKNSLVLIFSYMFTRLITFFSLVYLARTLGVADFGQLNFAQAIFLYFTLLTHLGLMTLGTREVACNPDQVASVTSDIVSLRLALAATAFLILFLVVSLLPFSRETWLLLLLFGLSLLPTAATPDWAFKGREKMGTVGLIEVFRAVPFFFFVLLFVHGPADLLLVPVLFFFGTLSAAAFSLWAFRRYYGSPKLQCDWKLWKTSLQQAWPLGLAFILVQVYYLMDLVTLGFLMDDQSVGWYSSGHKIVAFLLGIGIAYFEAIFPIISRLYRDSRSQLLSLLSLSTKITTWIMVPAVVGGMVLAQPLLEFLYGGEYGPGTASFRILIWAVAIGCIGMNAGYALMGSGGVRPYLRAIAVGAGCSMALNLALIPSFGLQGAAMARVFSELVIAGFFLYEFQRVSRYSIRPPLLKPLLASAAMTGVLFGMEGHVVARILLGAAAYAGVLLAIAPAERTDLYRALSRWMGRESPSQKGAENPVLKTEPSPLVGERPNG